MSRNDEFVIELLDNEVPAEYRKHVEKRVQDDPQARNKLKHYQSISGLMKHADEQNTPDYANASQRTLARLNRSFDALEASQAKTPVLRRLFDYTSSNSLRIPVPAAAAAALVAVFSMVLNFIPGNRFGGGTAITESIPSMDVVNYSELTNIDPNLMGLVVSGNSAAANSESSGDDGINLQINVQDVEQLLRILEEARNRNTGINDITIQIPSNNEFQILGDSLLRRVEPREVR